ncbi:MAG: hypothetical protein F6K54_35530 [Okeania sp. SIO3B5]|uniref:hypothetical protein n=1 Tax=Okeania sp. SIO3B5 TaxID=2607811 RepID=UPI0013FE922E|nr:hypothetical protein [Okeania sp. SIO3B5]NEO57905.1 hypothetical protein [Okeania sp. SIO3B5]
MEKAVGKNIVISCPVEYLHFGGGKAAGAGGRRQKRCDPASASDRLRNADQERECAPREERKV